MSHLGHRRYHIITLYIEIISDVEKTCFSPHTGGTAGAIFNVRGSGWGGGVWYSLFIKNLAHYSSH